MTPQENVLEILPGAGRLITSLRDIGYEFPTAVADIIDNSIAAGASKVEIDVTFDGDNSRVRIADNGKGMNASQLAEAMRWGTNRNYDSKKDLGKFGLGLKTASISQCEQMIVASRGSDHQLRAYSWDLHHIRKTDKWEVTIPSEQLLKEVAHRRLDTGTGTVVEWRRLDRILGYAQPYGELAKNRLATMCRELEQHLCMVFHRFMAGDVRGRHLKLHLNGTQLQPWDPFARSEKATKALKEGTFYLEADKCSGNVYLEPYVLPQKDDFSTAEAWERASGPKKWNRQQGFYVYRAERMIQSGGWSGIRTQDEHTKLARIALRFSPELDEAFKINVAKMRVQIPQQVRDQIEKYSMNVVATAQLAYRKKSGNPAGTSSAGRDTGSSPTDARGNRRAVSRTATWTINELQRRLLAVATPSEKLTIARVFHKLRDEIDD